MPKKTKTKTVKAKILKPISMAQAFDVWMAAYIENPERFENRMTDMKKHKRRRRGETASEYGLSCAEILTRIIGAGEMVWD